MVGEQHTATKINTAVTKKEVGGWLILGYASGNFWLLTWYFFFGQQFSFNSVR